MFNQKLKKRVGLVILFSQVFSALTPAFTFAATQGVSGTDIQNSLETVGTKANRLKTVGASGVDESSGAFTYSYPFSLPKGLSGLEPSIVLAYNSQSSENSIVGFGWSLAIPYIERTAKYGVDKIYTKNDFVSSLGGELILKPGTTNEYIQKIDDGSYQLYTFSNNIFTLRDRSGNTYTYGSTLDSRLSDTTGSKIQKYFLTSVKDTLGNQMKYFYEKKNGFVYPKEIVYTVKKDGSYSNKIVFEREERADKDISYKSGFRTEMTDRVKAIRAYTDGVEVAKLEIAYVTGQNGSRSLLSNIKESRVGTDNLWSTIPETKFEYEKGTNLSFQSGSNIQPANILIDITGDAKPETVSVTEGAPVGIGWTYIDYNGDYSTDKFYYIQGGVCTGSCTPTSNTGLIKKNTNGTFTDASIASLNFAFSSAYNIYTQPVPVEVNVLDVNGDGLQDFISSSVKLNNGGVFLNASFTAQTDILSTGDFNGDGLVDIVKDYSSSTASTTNGKYVFLNNGNGWNSTPETNLKIPFEIKTKDRYGTDVDGGFRAVDINADGLEDIIKSWKSNQEIASGELVQMYGPGCYGFCAPAIVNPGSESLVYINTGNGFTKLDNINLGGNSAITYDKGYVSSGWNPFWTRQIFSASFADSNFDGSPDFGGGVSSFKKQDILKSVVSPLGSKSEIFYKGSALQNNPKLPINILTVSEIKTTETNKNLQELVKYSYENGKMYYDRNNIYDRRFAGFEKVITETGTGNELKRTVKYFHQGDGDNASLYERGDSFHNIGRIFKEEVYAGSATSMTKFAETFRTFGVYTWDGQIYKYPKLEVVTEYDKTGASFYKAVGYDYDLAARLPKKTENFGEVKWDITTGNFSDIGEDYVLTKNIYNTKRPQKLLAEESSDINGKFLDKKIYLYDELPFGYVEKGLLTEERNYSNANSYVKTNYYYNNSGLLETKKENNGATTKYVYNANYNPITVTNALNQSFQTEFNKFLGVATKSTDQNGKIVQTVYDGFGSVKSVSNTSPSDDTVKLSATSQTTYSSKGMLQIDTVYSEGVPYKTKKSFYDSFGRLIRTESDSGEGTQQTYDVFYNNLGQVVRVAYPYDMFGILATYNQALDTRYIYDELGRVKEIAQGDLKNYTSYFIKGKVVSDNTAQVHKKEYRQNSQGKIESITEYNGTTAQVTKYEWNLLGNLTKIIDALGNVRNFTYDSEGRLLTQEDLHAPTDNTFGMYRYFYDENGRLIAKTDPSGNSATYTYDLVNRPIQENFGVTTTYKYDTCANGLGSLCEIENADYKQILTYNKSGNILSETKNIYDKTFTNTYSYNDLGQVTTITLPDTSSISYTYDKMGKQKTASLTRTVGGVASTTQVVTDAKYNIDGTVKELTQGNTVKTCFAYSNGSTGSPQAGGNTLPRLSEIIIGKNTCDSTSSDLLFKQNLSYDLFGSIIENKEVFGVNNFNSGLTQEINNKYTYDTLQRLTKNERQENNLNVVNNLTYNSIGNILSSDSTNYSYTGADYQNPHAPSIIGSTNMTYDLNGNVLDDGQNIYSWNLKNTLKEVSNDKSITEYTYDVGGERIKEVAKVKSGNSTSTFAVTSDTVVGEASEQVLVKDLPLITETSYLELKNNKLHSQNKIEMLFALALESNKYVKDVCAKTENIADINCKKKESIKFVASYLYTKHKVKLSAQTLEEMYGVYAGDLKLSNSADAYEKITDGNVVFEEYMNLVSGCEFKYPTNTSGCNNTLYNLYMSHFNSDNQEMYISFDYVPREGRIAPDANLTVGLNWASVGTTTTIKLNKSGTTNNYLVSVSGLQKPIRDFIKSVGVNYGYQMNFTLKGNISDDGSDVSVSGQVKNLKVFIGKKKFKNIVNSSSQIFIDNSVLNTKVYGTFEQQDKNLLGYIYKQKTIASLFGSDKLISKDTFNEMQVIGLSYSDIVIKDMLIDTSFQPYESCVNVGDNEKRNCMKEIFVKYFYAITRYETDKDFSVYALDELFEVSVGNLAIPNNFDEYNIYDIKNLDSKGFANQTLMYEQMYSITNSIKSNFCGVGYFAGTWYGSFLTAYSSCMPSFSLPDEVVARSNELYKVEIESLNISKTLTDLNVYLNMGNPTSNSLADFGNVGVMSTYKVGPLNYQDNSSLTVDISSLIIPWAKGTVSANGLRFTSNERVTTPPAGQSNFSNLVELSFPVKGISNLKYTFRKDASQNDRKYFTPLVTNPKDTEVYTDVLRVLARIDKEYKTGGSAIISQATYSEILNLDLSTIEKVKAVFDQNEKLQKDDTLAAVWEYLKTNNNQEITREALEELYMVWTDKLNLPVDVNQYTFATATTSKQYYDKNSWTFFTENGSGVKTIGACTPGGAVNCYLKVNPSNKSYTDISSAKLVFENASIGYGTAIKIQALNATPTDSLLLSNTSNWLAPEVNATTPNSTTVNAVLDPIYMNFLNGSYKNNGFKISSTYGLSINGLQNQTSTNNYIEYGLKPNFKVFDRNVLTNLSVVPGVFSLRSLSDNDVIVSKMYVATSSKVELKTAGIEKKGDIMQFATTIPNFTSTTTISRTDKINYLTKINSEIKRIKNVNLSREALEEIYYVQNDKLIINTLDLPAGTPQEISGLVSKYEMNGLVGTADKKKDTLRPDKSVFIESAAQTVNGRKADSNGAYQFVGNGFLKYPAMVPVVTNNAQTYSIWMKANTGGTQSMYSFASNNGSRNFFSIWYNNGRIVGELAWTGAGMEGASVKTVNDNLWHKVDVVIQNNPNANLKIYIDGVLDKELTYGSPYNMSSVSAEATMGAFQNYSGGGLAHYYNGALDDVKVYNKVLTAAEILTAYNNDTNPQLTVVAPNYATFDRPNFGILEPVENVEALNENKLTDNIVYNLNTTDIKIISAETEGELKLTGITTRQQILDIFALTKTTDKDSQISFFYNYAKVQKSYTFSREALEEIYLVYKGLAIFVPNAENSKIATTTDVYTSANTNWKVPSVCESSYWYGYKLWGYTWGYGSESKTCEIEMNIPTKYGYNIRSAKLNYSGLANTVDVFVNGVKAQENPTNGQITLSNYVPINGKIIVKFNAPISIYNSNISNIISGFSVSTVYELANKVQDRNSFGELSAISTEEKIDSSYSSEINNINFNVGTTSTSTLWKTSSVALQELASSSITTVQQIKDLFENSSTTDLGKDAKLYYVYKKIKDTKNISLSRLTLEEMWKISLDQQLLQGATLATTTVTTASAPTSLPAILHHKMDGTLGSTNKKKDEVVAAKLLTENTAVSTIGRSGVADTAYQLGAGGVNKLITTTPIPITNNPMTYSVWMKSTSASAYQRIISMNTDASRTFIDLNIYNGKAYFEIGNHGVVNFEGAGSATLANGVWHKLDLVVSNSPSATLKLYVDGELDRTLTGAAAYNLVGLSNQINLGCYGTGNNCTSPYNGALDDFRIYNKALTGDEIRREYQIDQGTIQPVITQTVVNSVNILDAFNRDRFKELEFISPVSILEYTYKVQTGEIVEEPVSEEIKNNTTPILPPSATLDTPEVIEQVQTISPETLALLNPLNYPYTPTSETSIDIQINGVTYSVTLSNYAQFYTDLDNNTINTLAKYVTKISNLSEEVEYTKYYPSSYYELDTRGYITINIPFNGKVVATVKYSTDNTNPLTETSFVHNNYLGTPVVITNSSASTTQVIKTDAWGVKVANSYNTNTSIPTEFGFTGHKWDENSELTYAHARYYAGNNRIWLSEDPVQFDSFNKSFYLMNPQSQNGYSYANNDPINRIDPDGRLSVKSSWEWLKQTASCFCSTATVTNNNQSNNTLLTSGNKFNVLDFNKQMVNAKNPRITDVSSNGIQFLLKAEGRSHGNGKYIDQGGYQTIGYGHLIVPGENFPDKLTDSEAEDLFRKDLSKFTNAINSNVSAKLNQNQYDALTSLIFNVGENYQGVYDVVNSRKDNPEDINRLFKEFITTNKQISNGLINRRNQEVELFNNGDYNYTYGNYER